MGKKDIFKRPECILDAQRTKSHNFIVELLIFLLVFMAIQLVVLIIALVPITCFIFSQREALAGDMFDLKAIMASPVFTLINLFITVAQIFIPMIYCCRIEKRSITTMGFVKKNWFGEYIIGLVVGLAIFSAAVGIGVLTDALEVTGLQKDFSLLWIAVVFVGFLIQGLSEEVLCRGYLMVSISRKYSLPTAIIVSSLVFAVLHLGNSGISVLAFVNLFLFGVFAAVYFIKRGSIWGIAAVHSIWNFAQGNLFGIKVSGMNAGDSILGTVFKDSGKLFNGGKFGLEGGLCVTTVLTVGIIVLSLLKDKNVPETLKIKES